MARVTTRPQVTSKVNTVHVDINQNGLRNSYQKAVEKGLISNLEKQALDPMLMSLDQSIAEKTASDGVLTSAERLDIVVDQAAFSAVLLDSMELPEGTVTSADILSANRAKHLQANQYMIGQAYEKGVAADTFSKTETEALTTALSDLSMSIANAASDGKITAKERRDITARQAKVLADMTNAAAH